MKKILEGLRDAVANNVASVTIQGVTYVRVGHEATDHQLSLARQKIAEQQDEIDRLANELAAISDHLRLAEDDQAKFSAWADSAAKPPF